MGDFSVKKAEKSLIKRTVERLDKESYYCGPAMGKLAEVVSAFANDKGGIRLVKSVYLNISKYELDKLLFFDEFSEKENCTIEIWFWKPREREPFERKKLFYNKPEQRISNGLKKFVKN